MPIGAIGKYERLEVLGHGASGIVYLAWDTLLRRNVALKEIRAAGPEMDRVLSEARVLDRLRHPNIIEVHSVDVQDGVILLDMELVRGRNLADVLRARLGEPVPPSEAVRITRAVLAALSYAHTRRIVHRDIKPANILIADDGATVKLTDFGLAEALGSGSVAGGGGTYPYMAPEDFSEDASSDYRADLWAVGVVLYELLTGKRPFAVQRSKDPFSWKRAIETETPALPSTLVSSLPEGLDGVVLKALAKNKQERYQSADAFDAALVQLGIAPDALPLQPEPRPTQAEQSTPPPPSDRWVFGDGTMAISLDALLLGAAKNWDESRWALSNGQFERFLRSIGEVYIADLAHELTQRLDLSPDGRLREFLARAQAEERPIGDDDEKTIDFAQGRFRRARDANRARGGGQMQREPVALSEPERPAESKPTETKSSETAMRWWFPFVFLLCLGPAAAGIVGQTRHLPLALAASAVVSAMLLLVGIGVRLPIWTRFVSLFPVALGVMAGGYAASKVIDGNPTPERLLIVSVSVLVPLGFLLIQAATARRLWRLWLTITIVVAALLTVVFR